MEYLTKSNFSNINYILYLYNSEKCNNNCLFCKAKKIKKNISYVLDTNFSYDALEYELKEREKGNVFLNGSGDLFLSYLSSKEKIRFLNNFVSFGFKLDFITNEFEQVLNLESAILKNSTIGIPVCSYDSRINSAILGKNAKSIDEITEFANAISNSVSGIYLFVSPVIPYVSQISKILKKCNGIKNIIFENFPPKKENLNQLKNIISTNTYDNIVEWYDERKSYRKYFRNAMYCMKNKFNLDEITVIQH